MESQARRGEGVGCPPMNEAQRGMCLQEVVWWCIANRKYALAHVPGRENRAAVRIFAPMENELLKLKEEIKNLPVNRLGHRTYSDELRDRVVGAALAWRSEGKSLS